MIVARQLLHIILTVRTKSHQARPPENLKTAWMEMLPLLAGSMLIRLFCLASALV